MEALKSLCCGEKSRKNSVTPDLHPNSKTSSSKVEIRVSSGDEIQKPKANRGGYNDKIDVILLKITFLTFFAEFW